MAEPYKPYVQQWLLNGLSSRRKRLIQIDQRFIIERLLRSRYYSTEQTDVRPTDRSII